MTDAAPAIPPGRVDLHSHLLPAIDDGCADTDDVLDCVHALRERGYTASVCTPHVGHKQYPGNTPAAVRDWTANLQRFLDHEGVAYRLIPGGELKYGKDAIGWMQRHGIPTLGESRHVLGDFWDKRWPKAVDKTFDWLLEQGYTPVLAHPERLRFTDRDDAKLESHLTRWRERGVLLQGNAEGFAGRYGSHAQARAERWLDAGWYAALALDLHRPNGLDTRFAGLDAVAARFGDDRLTSLIDEAPRRLLTPEPEPNRDA